jgi:hypothetical protein
VVSATNPSDRNFDFLDLESGLRSLEVASSDAGSNSAEIVEFLRTEKFREQVLREGL